MNKSWLLQYSGFWKEYSEAEEQTCLAYFTTNCYQKKPELSWAILPEDGYDFKDWLNGLKRNMLLPRDNGNFNSKFQLDLESEGHSFVSLITVECHSG